MLDAREQHAGGEPAVPELPFSAAADFERVRAERPGGSIRGDVRCCVVVLEGRYGLLLFVSSEFHAHAVMQLCRDIPSLCTHARSHLSMRTNTP